MFVWSSHDNNNYKNNLALLYNYSNKMFFWSSYNNYNNNLALLYNNSNQMFFWSSNNNNNKNLAILYKQLQSDVRLIQLQPKQQQQ